VATAKSQPLCGKLAFSGSDRSDPLSRTASFSAERSEKIRDNEAGTRGNSSGTDSGMTEAIAKLTNWQIKAFCLPQAHRALMRVVTHPPILFPVSLSCNASLLG
jgi:hypothetical protein